MIMIDRLAFLQWSGLFNAFLVEAKWFASGKLPNSEEYLKNGIVSSGVNVALVHIFFLLGQGTSKENAQLIDNFPAIISSTATILRLWDDLGSAKVTSQYSSSLDYLEIMPSLSAFFLFYVSLFRTKRDR